MLGVLLDEAFLEFWRTRSPHCYSTASYFSACRRGGGRGPIGVFGEIINRLSVFHARSHQRRSETAEIAAPALPTDFERAMAVHLVGVKSAAVLGMSADEVPVSL